MFLSIQALSVICFPIGILLFDTHALLCCALIIICLEISSNLPCDFFFQYSSFAQLCPTLCNPMDCSMSDLPVHHKFPEFNPTHVHWIGDAIQPSHPSSVVPFSSCLQSFPASASFQMSHFFTSGRPKYWSFSFSISPSNEYSGLIPLGWTGWIFLQSKGLSRVFSNTTVQKHQFCAQLSSQSNSHIHTWPLEKP